jgi:hypothetical protein
MSQNDPRIRLRELIEKVGEVVEENSDEKDFSEQVKHTQKKISLKFFFSGFGVCCGIT